MYFSDKPVKERKTVVVNYIPQLQLPLTAIDTAAWVMVSREYVAKGNESYFIIGCFHEKKIRYSSVRPSKNIHSPRHEAYYFIDDISIAEKVTPDTETEVPRLIVMNEKTEDTLQVTEPTALKTGTPFILKNIFFKTGKFELLSTSYKTLDSLYFMLHHNPNIHLAINGYTDSTGIQQENIQLSLNRAKSVYEYLISKGTEPGRLTYSGHGPANPVASNSTEEGREQNRRVEFILSKKND
jgi:outer membrane protein OmpA-like peptidoglycan-associated protein